MTKKLKNTHAINDLYSRIEALEHTIKLISGDVIVAHYEPFMESANVAKGITVEWLKGGKYETAGISLDSKIIYHPVTRPTVTKDDNIGVARISFVYDGSDGRFSEEYVLDMKTYNYMLSRRLKLKKGDKE